MPLTLGPPIKCPFDDEPSVILPEHPAVGRMAYIDCFTGLIPCKVLRVRLLTDRGTHECEVRVTETLGAYKEGDTLWEPLRDVVPRSAIRRSKIGLLSIKAYAWERKKN